MDSSVVDSGISYSSTNNSSNIQASTSSDTNPKIEKNFGSKSLDSPDKIHPIISLSQARDEFGLESPLILPDKALPLITQTSHIIAEKNHPLTPVIGEHHPNLMPKKSLPLVASTPNIGSIATTDHISCASDKQQKTLGDITPTTSDDGSGVTFQKLLKEKGLRATITNRTPRDFFFIKALGEGSFSTVYFAKEVDTGDDYAIKVLLKSEIRREKKVRYVLREKDVMAALTYAYGGHPFVVKLYCTFQDRDRLYFAITYAKHGELLDWLRRLGSFDEEVSLFYAAEILAALEFLHVKCKVIHRDLKPENILVGVDWHIMLSDFGTSKMLCGADGEEVEEEEPELSSQEQATPPPAKPPKTNSRSSFVGTAQYISPEVLKSENVRPECDYWALGAIIFQMISGQPPFRAFNEYQILKKILCLDYQYPQGFPLIAEDLVTKLLVNRPADRLGSKETGGIEALKRHKYFQDIDWENLPTRTPPELKPYLPASSGEPAFYSDYQLPENLEPGLNEAALNRLMGLGSNFGEFEYSKTDSPTFESIDSTEKLRDQVSPAKSPVPVKAPTTPNSVINPSNLPFASFIGQQRHTERLEMQRRAHKYHRFVDDQLILKAGLIDKKKGLFARRRMFLLTEGPRLFYVDPVNMELKGEVPFSLDMRTEAKNFRTFFVHTPKRTYYLFDPDRHAKDWCDAIDVVKDEYFKEMNNQHPAHQPEVSSPPASRPHPTAPITSKQQPGNAKGKQKGFSGTKATK